MKQIENMKT